MISGCNGLVFILQQGQSIKWITNPLIVFGSPGKILSTPKPCLCLFSLLNDLFHASILFMSVSRSLPSPATLFKTDGNTEGVEKWRSWTLFHQVSPKIIILYHVMTVVMATWQSCFFRKSSSLVGVNSAILFITWPAYLDILIDI